MVTARVKKVTQTLSKLSRKKQLGIKDRDVLVSARDELNELLKIFNSSRMCDGCGLLSSEPTTRLKQGDVNLQLCQKCGILFFQGKLRVKRKPSARQKKKSKQQS